MYGNPLTINDKNFKEEVLEANCPVLVTLEAEWSGTCMIVNPILERISSELSGLAKIGKLDIEKNEVGEKLPCKSLPAFLVYNKGEIVDIRYGLTTSMELKSMILRLLADAGGK